MTALFAILEADGRISLTNAVPNDDTHGDADRARPEEWNSDDWLSALRARTSFQEATAGEIKAGIERMRASPRGHFELEYDASPGGHPRCFLFRVYPIPSTSGLLLLHDELPAKDGFGRTQAEAGRLAAMAALSGGLAHELNNCLTAMLGFGELALSAVPSTTPSHGYLQQVVSAARRGRDLVTELLAFSRHRDSERQLVSPHVLLKETVRVLKSALPANIDLRTAIFATTRRVEADPTMLHHLFVSLLTRSAAVVQTRGGGVDVRLEELQPTAPLRATLPDLIADWYVRLTLTSVPTQSPPGGEPDGPGMGDPTSGQSGVIDLLVLRQFIDAHGGVLRTLDELGWTVEVYLPARSDGGS